MSKFTAKENYATPEGKFVGGTGKFFIPLPGGRHKGVYDRIVIKRIGAAS